MPFDPMPKKKQRAHDRGYQLVWALRNLPENHKWAFTCPSRCAMGLAVKMWPNLEPKWSGNFHSDWSKHFGLVQYQSKKCFSINDGNLWAYDNKTPASEVTPEMVADAIEKELEKDNAC